MNYNKWVTRFNRIAAKSGLTRPNGTELINHDIIERNIGEVLDSQEDAYGEWYAEQQDKAFDSGLTKICLLVIAVIILLISLGFLMVF